MKPTRKPAPGQVRIIGGRWRGSKLTVADSPGLRPSSDRVRETLFNWLGPGLPGANVLDLFAGSGALGLEAISRGASHATLVERDPALAHSLRQVVERLDAGAQVQVAATDALAWLRQTPARRFDIVFVDPPFAAQLWQPAIDGIAAHLADDAWVYLESPLSLAPVVPAGWQLHCEAGTREVRYALYRLHGAVTL
ncbi:16S rRNA (guanine(966)-N(2))-methyltransferase RsmD [Pseudoxanthomonas dokdonensis]|uniref:Ribosomal RNA small subunit methyltransferase D n=1 Tax=Pseudoxanthomonas dokdonensis TaxID=344882 RepID=A0A0R0CGZ9_9GAMM|nr:16S rRNA (guanine(966)-N(2))-methyltransferase RsmD [Pseudoxanthomonas dokdonensis]KRG69097.1 methyltransferase [Pseudoxanthomonas dokdonensis]